MAESQQQHDKIQLAVATGKRAQQLADLDGRNLVEMGLLALRMSKDPELPKLDGAKNYHNWMKNRFGSKYKTAQRSCRIVKALMEESGFEADFILAIGQTRAYELSRLPETERKSPDWILKAQEMTTASFKQAVKVVLEGSPDHRETSVTKKYVVSESLGELMDMVLGYAMNNRDSAQSTTEAIEAVFTHYLNDPANKPYDEA